MLLAAGSALTPPIWSRLNLGPFFDLSEVPAARKHFYVVTLLILFTLGAHTFKNFSEGDEASKNAIQTEAARIAQMTEQAAKSLE